MTTILNKIIVEIRSKSNGYKVTTNSLKAHSFNIK